MSASFRFRSQALVVVLAMLSLASAACEGERRSTFRGRYLHAFEASAFTECGATEGWWASFEARHPTLDSAIAAERALEDHTEVYLVVRGRLSPEGSYGHLGGSRRELRIEAIETVLPWDPRWCR